MAGLPKARVNNLNQRMHDVGIFDQDLTLDDARAINAFYDYTCLNCGAKPAISLDHVKPIMSGGTNKYDNIQNLCEKCNKAKGQKEIDYRKGRICSNDYAATVSIQKTNRKTDRELRPNFHGVKGRSGRKPTEITIAKRRLRAERVDDAQYMLDMLTTWAKDVELAVDFRRDCANDVLDRVLGKPTTMQPTENDDLQKKYLENVKRVIFGGGDSQPHEQGSAEPVESVEPGFHAVYAAIRSSTGSPSTN